MKRLLLIDLSGIYWMNYHATANQELSAAFDLTLGKVAQLRQGFDLVAVCCDAPPYFRKEILPTYKAQRDKPSEVSLDQLRLVKERLTADGLLLWEVRGFEADDVIAAAVEHAKKEGLDVLIASSDKDLLQLVDDEAGVSVVSVSSGQVYKREDVIRKFGVDPGLLGDELALMGDKSDNVPGAPGVGPKTAAKLLLEFGSLNGIFANLDKIKGAVQQSIFDNAEAVRLARKLVTLRTDVPIEWAQIHEERKQMPLADMQDDEDDFVPISPPPGPKQPGSDKPDPEEAPADPTFVHNVRALARLEPTDWNLVLEPASIEGAYRLAKGLANSRLYTRFPNPEAIWAIIIRGREMGLGALTALDAFHIVEGKPSPSAHLLIARCKAHPDCEYFQFIAGDATFAEYETKNRKNPKATRLRYTIDQARTAGLVKQGSNWDKRADVMLRKTAGVMLGRIEYPEVMLGLTSAEEMGG